MVKTINIQTTEGETLMRPTGAIEAPDIGETVAVESDYYEVVDVVHDLYNDHYEEGEDEVYDIWVIVEPTERDWWD